MDVATVDELLTTTRSVKKRLDFTRPVEPEVIETCIEIALQAPTGSNRQTWAFVVVTEAEKKRQLAELYRKGAEMYAAMEQPQLPADDPRTGQRPRILESSIHLLMHIEESPVLLIPCIEGRFEELPQFAQASMYGSILPAAWSFMLAARARGLGSAWTTMHLMFEKEAREILGIPDEYTQAALLPVAYFTGETFKPAKRLPVEQVTHWDTWGAPRTG